MTVKVPEIGVWLFETLLDLFLCLRPGARETTVAHLRSLSPGRARTAEGSISMISQHRAHSKGVCRNPSVTYSTEVSELGGASTENKRNEYDYICEAAEHVEGCLFV